MNILYIIGLIITIVTFIIISISIFITYLENRNNISLYFVLFFIIFTIGLVLMIVDNILDVNSQVFEITMVFTGLFSLIVLYVFTWHILEMKHWVNITVITIIILLGSLYILTNQPFYFIIATAVVFILIISLFYRIYKRQNDFKSLGMIIGLSLMFIALSIQPINDLSRNLAGIVYILSSIIFYLTFFNKLEKCLKYINL